MLKGIILENFKAFGTKQIIPFANITLICGANSSGKSSILQALLLLKQTFSESESADVLLLPRGNLVDLGSVREMLFRHDADHSCEISPLLAMPVTSRSRRYGLDLPGSSSVGFRFRYDSQARESVLDSLKVYIGANNHDAFAFAPTTLDRRAVFRTRRNAVGFPPWRIERGVPRKPLTLSHVNENNEFLRSSFNAARDVIPRMSNAVSRLQSELLHPHANFQYLLSDWLASDDDGALTQAADITTVFATFDVLARRLASYTYSQYLNDLRELAQDEVLLLRNFLPTDVMLSQVHRNALKTLLRFIDMHSGSRTVSQMWPDLSAIALQLAAELARSLESMSYLGPLRERPERHYVFGGNIGRDVGKSGRYLPDALFKDQRLVFSTNAALATMRIPYRVEVRTISDPRAEDVFSLVLQDQRSGADVSLVDAGFGISQMLPILAQAIWSHNRTILIEQPEIHLHPALQAELGSILTACIAAGNDNQFIIETHSEHLILRLQRLIRQGDLRADDVSVVFIANDGNNGAQCISLGLDEDGEFTDEWPGGFFEEGFRERFAGR